MKVSVSTYIFRAIHDVCLFKARQDGKAPMVPMLPKATIHIVAMNFLTLTQPWAIPTTDQTTCTTAMALWQAVSQPFGCSEILHSDQN